MHEATISCATHGQHLDIEDSYDDLEEGESLPQEYTDEVVPVARIVRHVEDVFPVVQKLLSCSAANDLRGTHLGKQLPIST